MQPHLVDVLVLLDDLFHIGAGIAELLLTDVEDYLLRASLIPFGASFALCI